MKSVAYTYTGPQLNFLPRNDGNNKNLKFIYLNLNATPITSLCCMNKREMKKKTFFFLSNDLVECKSRNCKTHK